MEESSLAKRIFRIICFFGAALALGPGSSIPNDMDMIFLMTGILFVSIGFLGVLITARPRPSP